MALTALQLSNNELTTSFVTQYTVPASSTLRLMETVFCNTSGVARTVTVCFPESGESADEATPIDDVRGSAEYRRQAAAEIVSRALAAAAVCAPSARA